MKRGILIGSILHEVYRASIFLLIYSMIRFPVIQASGVSLLHSKYNASSNYITNWIVDFLDECDRETKSPLIIAGSLSEGIITGIHNSGKRPITLFTKPLSSVDQAYARAKWTKDFYEKNFFRFQYTARIFLVAVSSQPILGHLLKQLKTSRWWNFSGIFLILDDQRDKRSTCRNAHSYLSTAWMHGLLSTIYLCLQDDNKTSTLYSYNPFGKQAPITNWRTVGIYGTGRNRHPWTLLRWDLDFGNLETSKISGEDIFFDKMRNLNGYPVRIEAFNLPPTLVFPNESNTSPGLNKYSGEDGWLAQTLWEHLNVTIIEILTTGSEGMGFTDENGVEHGVKADVRSGRVDMSLNNRNMMMSRNLGTTYPHLHTDYCFLTKSRGVIPLWQNLRNSLNPSLVLLTLGVILIAIPLLANLEEIESIRLTFDIMRLLIAASMVQIPRRFSARFIIAGLLIVIEIMNGILQGQLAAMVAKPRNYKEIDTLEELEKSHYEIRGFISFKNFITNPELKRRYVSSEIDEECFEMAKDGLPVACSNNCPILWEKSKEESESLHVAKEPIFGTYVHYIARIDWPILDKVNEIIARMVSAGLPDHWRKQTLSQVDVKIVSPKTSSSYSAPYAIRLNDLDSILYLLLGGLLISTLTFFVEVAFFKGKNQLMLSRVIVFDSDRCTG